MVLRAPKSAELFKSAEKSFSRAKRHFKMHAAKSQHEKTHNYLDEIVHQLRFVKSRVKSELTVLEKKQQEQQKERRAQRERDARAAAKRKKTVDEAARPAARKQIEYRLGTKKRTSPSNKDGQQQMIAAGVLTGDVFICCQGASVCAHFLSVCAGLFVAFFWSLDHLHAKTPTHL